MSSSFHMATEQRSRPNRQVGLPSSHGKLEQITGRAVKATQMRSLNQFEFTPSVLFPGLLVVSENSRPFLAIADG